MGLVEISEKMTTSVTIPGSRNPGTGSGSGTPTSGDQVVRKKRTFDIAFLTGQSEKESRFDEAGTSVDFSDHESPPSVGGHGGPSNNNNIEKKCGFLTERSGSPYNLTQDGTNSDSSSIDVMTNGSLSESESHSPSSCVPDQPSPPIHPLLLIHHHHLKPPALSNGGIRNSNNSGHDHRHHHDIKSNGGSSNKSRNNRSPVKEEIRFESRRTIDINHTQDSLKIKENLQFSTLLPSSAVGLNLSCGGGGGSTPSSGGNGPVSGSATASRTISVSSGADLSLPHLASIALLPHVARFPLGLPTIGSGGGGIHPGNAFPPNLPFHTKMEKSESINISYPKVRGAFPDPYAALAASAAGGYPYPNLLLSQELSRQNHPSFPVPLGSPGSGNPGQQVSQGPPPQCGPSSTLLPPSLTSLTLPAQNVCAKCNIGFRMTSDLVYHMRSHHRKDTDPMKKQREEKLKCPVCHETFRERHHLTRHMTAHQARPEEN